MNFDELWLELKDELKTADREARESHKAAMNSYGAGYDCGYAEGLRAAMEIVDAHYHGKEKRSDTEVMG